MSRQSGREKQSEKPTPLPSREPNTDVRLDPRTVGS